MNAISTLLVVILLVAGYLAIAGSVARSARNRRIIPALFVVVLLLYLCVVGFVYLLYVFYGDDPMIIYGALLLFALGAVVMIVRLCHRERQSMNWAGVALFLAYFALVVYVTLYIRVGTYSKAINMVPFERLLKAISEGSFEEVEHDLLNLAMFVPLGALIPIMNRRCFNRVGSAFLFGLITSTAIETTQLVAHLGECDINDIIANTAGAVVGYLLVAFYLRVSRNWSFS